MPKTTTEETQAFWKLVEILGTWMRLETQREAWIPERGRECELERISARILGCEVDLKHHLRRYVLAVVREEAE